ncbi:hypothetical protein TNCV_1885241 [Trichonephila clavipes]|nr:hypothetical protein TNCV_1885241 [Trichonephila clavipes]
MRDVDQALSPLIAAGSKVTVRFSLVSPQFRGRTSGRSEVSTFFSLPPTSQEDFRLNGYLEYHHAAKALYTYKHPYPPGFEPRPYGTAVSIANQ